MKLPIFAIDACSLIDRRRQQVPVFRRNSVVRMATYRPTQPMRTRLVEVHRPAIYENGAILIEKGATPLMPWNMDLSNPEIWRRGQYVNIYPFSAIAPDGSRTATLINWSAATTGSSQTLERHLSLTAERDYTISFLVGVQPKGGSFNNTGEIRLVGDAVGNTPIKLATLNAKPGEYQLLSTTFKSAGRQPRLPSLLESVDNSGRQQFNVQSVSGNSITIQLYELGVDDLKGGQLIFQGANQGHLITGNSLSDINTGRVIITTSTPSLEAFGITANMKVQVAGAPEQTVILQLYSEASATLMFAGAFLEEGKFATSPIRARGELIPRANTEIFYQKSPIQELVTFAAYVQLEYWKGDGNLFDAGNFKLFIQDGQLRVQVGTTSLAVKETLPTFDAKICVQVALETASVSVYINGQLKIAQPVPRTEGEKKPLVLTTEGVRVLKHMFFFDYLIAGGTTTVGAMASGDLLWLFNNAQLVISADSFSQPSPTFILPETEIPGMPAPSATGIILSANFLSRTITVSDSSQFKVGDLAVVLRNGIHQITWTSIRNIPSPGTLELENISGIDVLTDVIVVGNFSEPGRMSIRLPFEILASQRIDAIDPTAKAVRIATTVSFREGRAFIREGNFREGGQLDVREVVIREIDRVREQLRLDTVEDLKEGLIIVQPETEMLVSPTRYEIIPLSPIAGISVGNKAENGFDVFNANRTPRTARFLIKVNL